MDSEAPDLTAQQAATLNEMSTTHRGRPLDEVRPELTSRWLAMTGALLDEETLARFSEHIAAGGHFEPGM